MTLMHQEQPASASEQAGPETREFSRWLTVEQVLYILIGIASLLLHLWGLDQRALHHDETLHASYSWNIYTHRGYMHDPLLHGPFLYYFGSLMFFLFGDNDLTARLGFALFGVVLTLLPLLVRRELGRTAALLASLYLLISPTFLYVGRFARHDIYSITFEMLVFVAIVRYASTRKPLWLYLGAAAFGLMYTNQETSYLFLLIMAVPLVLLFLWRTFKPGIAIVGLVGVAVAALIFVLPGEPVTTGKHRANRDARGQMELESPGPVFGWRPLETDDNEYALCIRNRADAAPYAHSCTSRLHGGNEGGNWLASIGLFFSDKNWPFLATIFFYASDLWLFIGHPAVLSAIGVMLLGLLALAFFIWWQRDIDGLSRWQRAREHDTHILPVYGSLFKNRRWLIALGIFLLIYVLFFTAFLTNLMGTVTGTTGSLLYWLAQHNVERGGQPLYYYGTMLAVYEPLLLFWGIVGIIIAAVEWVRNHNRPDARPPLTIALVIWWTIAAFALYSWAGEKMPWLTTHVALPLVLLSAWAGQRAIAGVFDRTRSKLLIAAVGIFFATVGLNYTILSIFVNATERADVPGLVLVLLTTGLLMMVIVILGINWGWRWAVSVLALCLFLTGGFYTLRNTHRVVYRLGDVPREMLIYTQTSPDVRRVVRRLEAISYRRTAGLDMPVIYDNETVWTWYLRNFPNASRTGPQLSSPPDDDVMAVVILQENLDNYPDNLDKLQGFQLQRFPLRWWFPESKVYRLSEGWQERSIEQVSLLGSVLREPTADQTIIRLWRFLIHRNPQAALGSTDFVLAVRPEIAPQVGPGIGKDLRKEGP
jgi:predicted membrane-bound mannosyltransferase